MKQSGGNLDEIPSTLRRTFLDQKSLYEAMKEEFKFVYNQRSEISHGSRVDILKGDLEYASTYAINLLYKFIINDDIKTMSKNKELKAYLETKAKTMEEGAI